MRDSDRRRGRPTERSRPAVGSRAAAGDEADRSERLQKILALAGFGSRRQCEELITAGRVEVDRQVITSLGSRADFAAQEIRVDGERLRKPKAAYYVVNKPRGVVCTHRDPAGRPRVVDYVPDRERLFPVGRLDVSSEGLILLTNDGDLANRLAHPRYGVEKTYLVEVAGSIDAKELSRLRRGVHLSEGFAHAVSARVKKQRGKSTLLEIVLDEGRNREVRRILARVGHKVLRLTRIALGPLRLGEVPPGAYRALAPAEVAALRADATPAAYRKRLERRRRAAEHRPADETARSGAEQPAAPRPAASGAPAGRANGESSPPAEPQAVRTVIGADTKLPSDGPRSVRPRSRARPLPGKRPYGHRAQAGAAAGAGRPGKPQRPGRPRKSSRRLSKP